MEESDDAIPFLLLKSGEELYSKRTKNCDEDEETTVDSERSSRLLLDISRSTQFHQFDPVASLEKKLSDLEQNNKNLDNITQNHGIWVFTLELRIAQRMMKCLQKCQKYGVQMLYKFLRDHFRDLTTET
ncbi:hypothetical protein Tco_1275566 [Tanacetum coccineum]